MWSHNLKPAVSSLAVYLTVDKKRKKKKAKSVKIKRTKATPLPRGDPGTTEPRDAQTPEPSPSPTSSPTRTPSRAPTRSPAPPTPPPTVSLISQYFSPIFVAWHLPPCYRLRHAFFSEISFILPFSTINCHLVFPYRISHQDAHEFAAASYFATYCKSRIEKDCCHYLCLLDLFYFSLYFSLMVLLVHLFSTLYLSNIIVNHCSSYTIIITGFSHRVARQIAQPVTASSN